ncbi:hypothetical protein SAMN02910456_02707 [Ruminococcaceae bacterium YRB3002]|nr:hypothetical protein SAMN02910456_02707 [Ruminococcaceae bacterium YRB3002]
MKKNLSLAVCVVMLSLSVSLAGCSLLPQMPGKESGSGDGDDTETSLTDFTTTSETTTEATTTTTAEETEATAEKFDINVHTVGDIIGESVNKVYSSPLLGISYEYPEHCSTGNRDAAQDLFKDIQKVTKDTKVSEVQDGVPIIGAYIIWTDNSLMEISYFYDADLSQEEYDALLQASLNSAVQNFEAIGYTTNKAEIGKMMIDGNEFDCITLEYSNNVARKHVVRYKDGIVTDVNVLSLGQFSIDSMLAGLHMEA